MTTTIDRQAPAQPDTCARPLLRARLATSVHAPRVARRAVHDACVSADLPVPVADAAELVAGQLVVAGLRQHLRPLQLSLTLADDPTLGTVATVRVSGEPTSSAGRTAGAVGTLHMWDLVRRRACALGYSDTGTGRQLWAAVRADAAGLQDRTTKASVDAG
ncbi:hypothetical protein [Jatrophihabitans fulvus]